MRTKTLTSIALTILILLSALCLVRPEGKNHDKGILAAELTLETTQDGNQERRTYVNYDGEPVIPLDRDCATLLRTKNDDGNVVLEQYLDVRGEPALRSGNYAAVSYRREAGEILITYLDAAGNPAPTSAGYTMLSRSYYRDGYPFEDRYFDADGNPFALSKGQYGVRRVGDATLQLNRNGHLMLSIDNLLNGLPVMVVLVGCLLCIALCCLPGKLRGVLLAAYVVFIFYETLMFRETGDPRTALIPFSYVSSFCKSYSVRLEVINNIWLFVPLGAGLSALTPKRRVLWIPFLLTVGIEVTQYLTGLGLMQADDILGNTLGAVGGFLLTDRLCSIRIWLKNGNKNGETG